VNFANTIPIGIISIKVKVANRGKPREETGEIDILDRVDYCLYVSNVCSINQKTGFTSYLSSYCFK